MTDQPIQLSFHDHRMTTGWGGRRRGAGRKRQSERPPVHHVRRPAVAGRFPCHVTVRVRGDVPNLRTKPFLREFRRTLRLACDRGSFRVVHYSVQANHVHLLVEAAGKAALGRGMKAVGARFARAVNRVFERRGPVVEGRYHLRVLKTPREVRRALAYVLLNVRKHWRERRKVAPPVRMDAASSGRWFAGWRVGAWDRHAHAGGRPEPPEVAPARTWLLATGWRRHGLINPAEVPG